LVRGVGARFKEIKTGYGYVIDPVFRLRYERGRPLEIISDILQMLIGIHVPAVCVRNLKLVGPSEAPYGFTGSSCNIFVLNLLMVLPRPCHIIISTIG
jgi:hypothetical protein